MSQLLQKQAAAECALQFISEDSILGVGTGSTINCLIDVLPPIKGAVVSSIATEKRLRARGIDIFDLNEIGVLDLYIDGADEIDKNGHMIKGGGGALTREKIVAAASKRFICIADETKCVDKLGTFAVAVEVLPQARSYVARQLVQLGGTPVYRQGFITDYGNVILDTHDLDIADAQALEHTINNIVGVVCVGIFAAQKAHTLVLASKHGMQVIDF